MGTVSLFGALNTGVSGLFVSRMATNLINHNIANANTPGYSRQRMVVAANRPLSTTFGAVGRGAEVMSVDRMTNRFLERQVFDQNAELGTYGALDDGLLSVEQILGSAETDRIGDAMNSFFDAWSDLASDPGSRGLRSAVVAQSKGVALVFRDIAGGMNEVARRSRNDIDTMVERVNALSARIGALNTEIIASKSEAGLPNDLVDQRNLLVSELSELGKVHIHERGDGSLDVSMGGRNLVARGVVNELRAEHSDSGDGNIRTTLYLGNSNDLPLDPPAGRLAGSVRFVNESIVDVRERLDELASQFMDRVNELHREGSTAVGSGIDLFEGSSAGDIVVTAAILEDPDILATGALGAEGDGTIADAIANLRDDVAPGESTSLTDRYVQLVVDVATERNTVATLREGQETILSGVVNRLESTRGVSIDEEMANLIQYQRSFEANARVISIVDGMLNTLINGMI